MHPRLAGKNVSTFPQGSHRNRVNVRRDSDVDVCCLYDGVFYYKLPAGYEEAFFGFSEAPAYTYCEYKDDVEAALVARFGRAGVERGSKAFDVHENKRRVDADVVATFAYREYYITPAGYAWHKGTALLTDREKKLVTNFPQQQYDNGVAKHDATGRRFKKQVRIQKTLRNEIEEHSPSVTKPITSFLIECWVWNAPNNCFNRGSLFDDFEAVMKWVYNNTAGMKEVNGIKPLFGAHNPWTEADVRTFIEVAWKITH